MLVDAQIFLLSRVCVCVCLVLLQGVKHTHSSKNVISYVIMLVVMRLLITKHSAAAFASGWQGNKILRLSPSSPLRLERLTSGTQNDKHFHKRCHFLSPPALSASICGMRTEPKVLRG